MYMYVYVYVYSTYVYVHRWACVFLHSIVNCWLPLLILPASSARSLIPYGLHLLSAPSRRFTPRKQDSSWLLAHRAVSAEAADPGRCLSGPGLQHRHGLGRFSQRQLDQVKGRRIASLRSALTRFLQQRSLLQEPLSFLQRCFLRRLGIMS